MNIRKVKTAGATFAAIAYSQIILTTIVGGGEGLSLTTFALWATLGWITSMAMLLNRSGGVDVVVPVIYSSGATILSVVLLYQGQFGWSGLDTVVTVLTLGCIVLWKISGPRAAIVLSITAAQIAAVPFIKMTWQSPENSPVITNFLFFVANILSFMTTSKWTIEERLFPGVNILMGVTLLTPCVISWLS